MEITTTTSISRAGAASLRAVAVIAGGILFQAVFWQEKMGINTVLFALFIATSIVLLYRPALQWRHAVWLACASFITLAAVIIHNTLLSKIAFTTSFILLIIYSSNAYRSIHYGFAIVADRLIYALPQFLKDWAALIKSCGNRQEKKYNFRILMLPMILALLFTGIYLLASDILADIASRAGDWLGVIVSHVFEWISIPRLFFTLLGIFTTAVFLISYHAKVTDKEALEEDTLTRKRDVHSNTFCSVSQPGITGKSVNSMLALKLEYKGAVISLVLLNILLVCLNATDVIYVWFNRIYKPGFEWVGFVHNGAETLVFSILLAMAVLLYFFRGNISFLQKNKALKTLAYIWLTQNFILAISVVIRNYYYVTHMGLAYKRVGLFVFVLVVAAGLVTIYTKISKNKTAFYLLRINGWVAFAVLIASSAINWDVVIARYNLSKSSTIPLDVSYLLSLNDETIPVLDGYKAYLAAPQSVLQKKYYEEYADGSQAGRLEWRKQEFKKDYESHKWLSWNYADSYVHYYLENKSR